MSKPVTVIEIQLTQKDEKGVETTETVEIDLDLNTLTLKESVALEEALGTEQFDALMEKGEFALRPSVIQAILYARIKGKFPGIEIGDFDFDLSSLDLDGGLVPAGRHGKEGGPGNV